MSARTKAKRATTEKAVSQESSGDGSVVDAVNLGPLSRMAGYALRRAQIAVFEDFITSLAEVNLRPAQFSVLLVLDQAPGSTQSAVAAALGIQRANFVSMLDALARRAASQRSCPAA